ncbi:MAG: hypothetical protein IIA87_05690 [Nanoarchaeota archaeon]|nr:hypothetical protein [Nanoarchaeota archaeon]
MKIDPYNHKQTYRAWQEKVKKQRSQDADINIYEGRQLDEYQKNRPQ